MQTKACKMKALLIICAAFIGALVLFIDLGCGVDRRATEESNVRCDLKLVLGHAITRTLEAKAITNYEEILPNSLLLQHPGLLTVTTSRIWHVNTNIVLWKSYASSTREAQPNAIALCLTSSGKKDSGGIHQGYSITFGGAISDWSFGNANTNLTRIQ